MAARLRLGLIAVRMPGSPSFGVVRDRFDATNLADWEPVAGTPSMLRKTAVADIVRFVREKYVRQVLRRRVYLESVLRRTWLRSGLSAPTPRIGLYDVTSPSVPHQDYTLHLSTKPPRLSDVRRVTDGAGARHPVVVGPVGLLPPADRTDVAWLAGKVALSLTEEGRMLPLARAVKNGWVPI